MQALDRLTAVLEVVARSDGPTLSEVIDATQLSTASCHRLLSSCTESGLLTRDRSRRYWPGPRLAYLANLIASSVTGAQIIDRVLTGLRDGWQECSYVAAFIDNEVVCVRTVEVADPHRASLTMRLGQRFPLHASAASRAVLAELSELEAITLLRSNARQAFTPLTKTSLGELRAELLATRARGYALCDQEIEEGLIAVAVPIRGATGPLGALGAMGVREAMRGALERGLVEALNPAAEALGGIELAPIAATPTKPGAVRE